jgi:hypothetical protein
MALNFHEDLGRSLSARRSSDRSFGLVFAAVLGALALWPLHAEGPVRVKLLVCAAAFLLIAMVRPTLLGLLNKAWTLLGLAMGRIANPIIMAVLFFLVFTPAGLISRWLGKDPLRLKRAREARTYWIVRNPPGPQPDTMSKQF